VALNVSFSSTVQTTNCKIRNRKSHSRATGALY
jgi:hypothetical protein